MTRGAGPASPAAARWASVRRIPHGIDPRIWARRAAVVRSRTRRRRWLVGGMAVALLVAGAALALLHSGWFEARHRLLQGAVHTPASAVWRAAGIGPATPLIDVSAAAAARRIDMLPWVDRASVVRQWPDTVRVTVTERIPVAVVGQGSQAVLVDRSGRALALASTAGVPATLPLVVSAAGPVAVGHWVAPTASPGLVVAAGIPRVLAGEVRQVLVSPGGLVTVALAGGVTADLGAPTAVQAKFESLAAVLADPASAPTAPATIDVRDPGTPVVGPPRGG